MGSLIVTRLLPGNNNNNGDNDDDNDDHHDDDDGNNNIKSKWSNDLYPPYSRDFFAAISLTQSIIKTFELPPATLQYNDCTRSSFLLNLLP